MDTMASTTSTLASGLEKVKDAATGSAGPEARDIERSTHDFQNSKEKMTTDYGVKVSNTDNWLSVSTEDKTG